MKTTPKLSGEERRAAIIKAVRRVFADKGFDGTTTRELAEAAAVSEALLFKHFPTKEALFAAMQESCCDEQDVGLLERLTALEPSASTLVLLVHFLVSRILTGCAARDEDQTVPTRLMLRSLASDGEFARSWLIKLGSVWIPKVEECVTAAVDAGEAVDVRLPRGLRGWFAQHLAAMLATNLLPETPVVDYGVTRDKLVEHAVRFALRGMGLKEEAVRRYYNPKALALFEG